MTYFDIIQELQQIKQVLASIKPVKLENKIQWTGLIGVAQDMWADRKSNKLCTTKIINDTDYLNLPFLLAKRATELEEYLSKTTNVDDSLDAMMLIHECYNMWNNICPEISSWTISEEKWNNHPLPLSLVVHHKLYHSFNKYNIPEEIRNKLEANMLYIDNQIERTIHPVENKSGCLSVLLLLIIPLSVAYFLL